MGTQLFLFHSHPNPVLTVDNPSLSNFLQFLHCRGWQQYAERSFPSPLHHHWLAHTQHKLTHQHQEVPTDIVQPRFFGIHMQSVMEYSQTESRIMSSKMCIFTDINYIGWLVKQICFLYFWHIFNQPLKYLPATSSTSMMKNIPTILEIN